MRVAIDISPISKHSTSAHKVRGVGMYINMLHVNLPRFDKKNEYIFVEDKNFPLDVDLIHYPYFDPFFLTLPNRFPKKFAVTVHDLTPLVFPNHFPAGVKGKIKWMFQRNRLQKANLVITDSDCSRNDVRKIGGIGEGSVKTVYLAADERFKMLDKGTWIKDVRKKYNLPEKFLLYVGDATWNKNLSFLVDVIKKTDYKLVMVGKIWESSHSEISNNSWNTDLKTVLLKIQNDEQFIRLGFASDEDLVKIYNLSTVLVMPSIYEGFGLPVLEAMKCGCPVICSKAGSLPEIGGEAVLYIDPTSSDELEKGIEKIFGDKKLQLELSKKGLEHAKKFSVEKSIKGLINCYESIH